MRAQRPNDLISSHSAMIIMPAISQLMHCQTAWTFLISQQRMNEAEGLGMGMEWTEIDTNNKHTQNERVKRRWTMRPSVGGQ